MSFPVPKEYDLPGITYNNGNVITLPPSLSGDGTGVNLSQLEKNLILTLFSKAAYVEDDAGTAYDTLENLWSSTTKELESITAVYTQSGTVYDTDTLDSLKADLVVTANYSDGTSDTVPSSDYTLSGTLTEGTSTVTVSYGGKTATFSVTVASALSDYTLFDYIKCTSTAYSLTNKGVLTDIAMNSDYTLETSLKMVTSKPNPVPIFGTRSGSSGTKEIAIFASPSTGKLGYWINGVDTTNTYNDVFSLNTVHSVKYKPVGSSTAYPSDNVIEVDGTDYALGANTSGVAFDPWLGFFVYAISASSLNTGSFQNANLSIGTTTIKDGNGNTLHRLIPATNSESVQGLIDAVTRTWYPVNDTTIFECGNWE